MLDIVIQQIFVRLEVKCFIDCASRYICVIKPKLDEIFIHSLFRQSTSTCFGNICSPSTGGILYIYNNLYVLCFPVECLLAGL